MRRLVICCLGSVLLYVVMFDFVLGRPLSVGILEREMQQKTARLAALPSPKIVILAGSNGPYSHSCAVIGPALGLPCENAGIAVGIGLDEIFARDAPFLRKGDIVYMPMELQQYTATRAQYDAGADAGLLMRDDPRLLWRLPWGRRVGAVFCCTIDDLLESLLEMPVARAGFLRADDRLAWQYDDAGDRINTPLAQADGLLLTMPARVPPAAAAIGQGYGAALIAQFTRMETARGVMVIGGLPTDFVDAKLGAATIGAIAAIYTQNGGRFKALPNESEYPRADFFDSEDHLAQPYQYMHSIAVAKLLVEVVGN